MSKILITGGFGFLGSNLLTAGIEKGHEIFILDNLSRSGSYSNFRLLANETKFKFIIGDIRDLSAIDRVLKEFQPDVIFHLAGQVAMTQSIENPTHDFSVNTVGTLNLLESVRTNKINPLIIYSSTNKVYGDLGSYNYVEKKLRYECLDFPHGFDESIPLNFQSPYGCSKGAADQYLLDYSRIFNLRTVVFRHSSMYGGFQNPSVDQGWVGWFIKKALEQKDGKTKKFTISGNGKQVRDLLHSDDVVDLYYSAVENAPNIVGKAFNIGGGIENSSSILELFEFLEFELGREIEYEKIAPRESDQLVFIADNTKIEELLNWSPKLSKSLGLKLMIEWFNSNTL